jgi:hypothetical protein
MKMFAATKLESDDGESDISNRPIRWSSRAKSLPGIQRTFRDKAYPKSTSSNTLTNSANHFLFKDKTLGGVDSSTTSSTNWDHF